METKSIVLAFVQATSYLGHAHARNRGASRSCGDILMFLDSDDIYMDPHMLYLWTPLAINNKVRNWSTVNSAHVSH